MSNRKLGNTPLRVLFRTEGGSQLGLGHLSRCRSLATAFMAYDTEMYCALSDQALGLKFLQGLPVVIREIDAGGCEQYDIAILDLPGASPDLQRQLGKIAKLVVQIDDEGDGPFLCQILIRPNLLGLSPPKIQAESSRYWTGRDYIIIHPDFAVSQERMTTNGERGKRILVCFGGSDPALLTMKLLPTLVEFAGEAQVEVILGEAFQAQNLVLAGLAEAPSFFVTTNCTDMANRLLHSDLAIISGGTMLYEVASLGVPAIVICQNNAQQAEAEIFARAGAVVNLGTYEQGHGKLVRQAMNRLLGDAQLMSAMSMRGRQLVSGRGAQLVVEKIVSQLARKIVVKKSSVMGALPKG